MDDIIEGNGNRDMTVADAVLDPDGRLLIDTDARRDGNHDLREWSE
ncbi:hypothetical protein [Halococcus saccharolyticus]|nr:hypothetical protein [Halococcus saccharolyticus]